MCYLRVGRLGAIHCEWARDYTAWPLFRMTACDAETIIDMPFCRIILTPGRLLS